VAEAAPPGVTVPPVGNDEGAGTPAVYDTVSVVEQFVPSSGCVQLYPVLQFPVPSSLVFMIAGEGHVKLGAACTVNVAPTEVALDPQFLVTTTSYVPLSLGVADAIV
jgi:hypothetical protein